MVTFNFSYAPGTTLEQMVGFETAGRIWSSYLKDDVTINLHVGVSSDLPTGVIGGALPGIHANQRYEDWRIKLASDRTSPDDQSAFLNQQDDPDKFTALIDGYKVDNNETLNLTRANAKALGMLPARDTALDGYIVFGSLSGTSFSWSYDYTSGPASSQSLDFLSTAIHEIGHVLGFVSGVDQPGWLTQVTDYKAASDFYASLTGRLSHATPLDMFRFSAESRRQAGSGDSWIDLSIGSNPYFSVDGGWNSVGQFATGRNTSLGGDGYQASHWKQGTFGVMNPTLSPGSRMLVSGLDLRAMDVIGWDLAPNVMNLNLDLSALVEQSRQTLADRLGQSVAWLSSHETAATKQLTQDLSKELETMVENSQVYNWGVRIRFGGYRQVVEMMSRQEIYTSFQTLNSDEFSTWGQEASLGKVAGWLGVKALGWLQQSSMSGVGFDESTGRLISQLVRAIALQPASNDAAVTYASSPTLAFKNFTFSGSPLLNAEKAQSLFSSWQRYRYTESVESRFSETFQQVVKAQVFEPLLSSFQVL